MLVPGAVLTNAEVVEQFQVGNMGGMRKSNRQNCLVLISDPHKGLYEDKWDGEVLHYTGMGKRGHQTFTSQNRTLRDAAALGVTVHLLEVFTPKYYTYIGEVELTSAPYTEQQLDEDGQSRDVIMFPLRVVGKNVAPIQAEALATKQALLERKVQRATSDKIASRAKLASGKPSKRTVATDQYERDPWVVAYAKQRAQGICQLCNAPAPFIDKYGEPYLEVHHIEWLSKGGSDSVDNVAALCPNCHRKMHVVDDSQDVRVLQEVAK